MTEQPPRPDWMHSSKPPASDRPQKRKVKRRRRPVIKIDADEQDGEKPPLLTRMVNEIRFGSTGYLSSLMMHLGLLLVMAILLSPDAYRLVGGQSGTEIQFNFGELDKEKVEAKVKEVGKQAVRVERKPIQRPDQKRTKDPVKRKTPGGGKPKAAGNGPLKQPVKPVNVDALFATRKPQLRDQILEKIDPKKEIRRSVSLGLAWLNQHQESAGNWKLYNKEYHWTAYDKVDRKTKRRQEVQDYGYEVLNTDTGATALALLAFLGDGHTHKKKGPYQKTVDKGLKWLLGTQKSSEDRDGDFYNQVEFFRQTRYYSHCLATIVVCEAYAMTKDETLRGPAERAVGFLIRSQNPVLGGWKYSPLESTSLGDLSVTGWALMAMHSARAAGITVPKEAFDLAAKFLDSVSENNGSRYRYDAGKTPSPTMTAEGLLCRQYLGWPRNHPPLVEGFEYLQRPENRPRWLAAGQSQPVVYYWYYAGHVYHNMGGNTWTKWYQNVAELIVKKQLASAAKNVRGSWSPVDYKTKRYYGYGEIGGRLYTTAMCLLVLELPYRHQPVYREKK